MPSVAVAAVPAPVAALVMLAGLGLMYFALSGLGLIKPSTLGTGNASGSNVLKNGKSAAQGGGTSGSRTF